MKNLLQNYVIPIAMKRRYMKIYYTKHVNNSLVQSGNNSFYLENFELTIDVLCLLILRGIKKWYYLTNVTCPTN